MGGIKLSEQIEIVFPRGRGERRLKMLMNFAINIIKIQNRIGFSMSARGWAYQLEGFRLINKNDFNRVQNLINECRKIGFLPVDFIMEDSSRAFRGVEKPDIDTPKDWTRRYLEATMQAEDYFTPNWWHGEEYYIQMLVEKVDLKTLFYPVCHEYHIPIATSKGWSSITQRAVYARRFKEAQELDMKCVLLYCSDFDPDGLRISQFLKSNLYDIANIRWQDKTEGYNPRNLIIDRFGLNYDFITENKLTWIDNLITGSKKDLASPSHPNHYQQYVQSYLAKYGERKCEANAIVTRPRAAQKLCRDAIEEYLHDPDRYDKTPLERFQEKRDTVNKAFEDWREGAEIQELLDEASENLDASESEEIEYED